MSQEQKQEQYSDENKGNFDIEEGLNAINKIDKENSLHFIDNEIRRKKNHSDQLDHKIESIHKREKFFILLFILTVIIVILACYIYNETALNKYIH